MVSIQASLFKMYYQFQKRITPPQTEFDVVKARAEWESIAKMFKPLARFTTIPVDVQGIRAEWITPLNVIDKRTVLYLHGGYNLIGSIQSYRNLAGNIANAAQSQTLI